MTRHKLKSTGGKRIKKPEPNATHWLWEFSKRVVLICFLLYIFSFFYSCFVMWQSKDFTYLGTYISEASDILKTCVFGYFVKAGVENAIKIKVQGKAGTENVPASIPEQNEEGMG